MSEPHNEAISSVLEALGQRLKTGFDSDSCLPLHSLPGSADAFLAAGLQRTYARTILWIAPGLSHMEANHRNLAPLESSLSAPILFFPPPDANPGADPASRIKKNTGSDGNVDRDIIGHRLKVLFTLADETKKDTPFLIVTCLQAIQQPVIPPSKLQQQVRMLEEGKSCDREELLSFLISSGFAQVSEVLGKGQVSARGGIVDLWPVSEAWPSRIELAPDSIESIRLFDPLDQRSIRKIDQLLLMPCREETPPASSGMPSFLAYLPENTVFVWSHEELLTELLAPEHVIPYESLKAMALKMHGSLHLSTYGEQPEEHKGDQVIALEPLQGVPRAPVLGMAPDLQISARQNFLSSLQAEAAAGYNLFFFFDSAASRDHCLKEDAFAAIPKQRLHCLTGMIGEGFRCRYGSFIVITENDLYGRRKLTGQRYDPTGQKPRAAQMSGLRSADLSDLEPGDFVVHMEHGIGIYRGLNEIIFNDRRQEVFSIEYAGESRLHVPISHAHLVSRYVSLSKETPRLHTLGGRKWIQERADAEKSIMDFAAAQLELQARRQTLKGHAFGPDKPWQKEFEASFPYRETPDQSKAIIATRQDMESARPMDRLICGDAGYGKTEIAIRAAFKAVLDGKQVAVLVPTTVLAQQHYETFSERMSAYPVRIEMLSRFSSSSRRGGTLRGISAGTVDIVIGTHALLQPSITFHDLGLVIVDEEQRFGVENKERLKQLRELVDVLTLSATPIPRTLYLSLTGVKEMSVIQTPPGERLAVETVIARNTDDTVRAAIDRELSREGQVYYLHNRIMTIHLVEQRIRSLCPHARIAVAHGRMPSHELSNVMRGFADGSFDILLCTTIIESGLDIPRANTILIDRADRFGLADLYQLRGRVGRSHHKAYAYMLVPPAGRLDSAAADRLGAVRKHSGLSVGFTLALKDLELRGAGNILGTEQSGYVRAVGFDLYCQLLRRTILRLQGKPVPQPVSTDLVLDFISFSTGSSPSAASALIPFSFIEEESLRIRTYRQIAEAVEPGEIAAITGDLTDRFGTIPPETMRLLNVARLRLVCHAGGISRIETQGAIVQMWRGGDWIKKNGRFPVMKGRTADQKLAELIALAEQYGRTPVNLERKQRKLF
jgi:transcription-repair coupling factor (superfamily II helicase)